MQILKLHQECAQVTSKKMILSKAGCLKGMMAKTFSMHGTIGVLKKEPSQEFSQAARVLNKPKSAKRKLPKGKQTANKRNRTECDQLVELREHKDDFSENWEGVPVDDSSLNDPWLSFKPEDCPVPPGWFWIQSSDVPEEINCENCLNSLTAEKSELPSEFYAAYITKLRSKGFLRFASLGFYYTISKVERILQKHLQSHQAYIRDSFQLVISEVVGDGLNLPPICCEAHRHEQLSFLVYEYVVLRYHIKAKRFKNDAFQQLKSNQQ
ncbi:uncharacterized protein LOC124207595 [Daphnia pulex]|uniref:uncharacterized protein LOC124207595 n=1 Tax=Daphnia pulex TaxID=6669 RepID=UPI001EDD7D2D|nr:uncharacterized protein LOC124207595 [Daphnia pulex]XP_046461097.1 uncharacterized protein LOC124207595 [Daphnia pulex]